MSLQRMVIDYNAYMEYTTPTLNFRIVEPLLQSALSSSSMRYLVQTIPTDVIMTTKSLTNAIHRVRLDRRTDRRLPRLAVAIPRSA